MISISPSEKQRSLVAWLFALSVLVASDGRGDPEKIARPATQPYFLRHPTTHGSGWVTVLYLEDNQIETDQPTSVVIYVQNTTKVSRGVSNAVETYPVQEAPEAATSQSAPSPTTHFAAASINGDQAPLKLVVTFRGRYDEPVRPITEQVSSLRLESVAVEPNSGRLFRKTIVGRFRAGQLTVQATLFDGNNVVGRSKPKVLNVVEASNGGH